MERKIEKLLRDDADAFALTVAVVAAEVGRPPAEVAQEALSDALARLTETGVLGSTIEDEDEED